MNNHCVPSAPGSVGCVTGTEPQAALKFHYLFLLRFADRLLARRSGFPCSSCDLTFPAFRAPPFQKIFATLKPNPIAKHNQSELVCPQKSPQKAGKAHTERNGNRKWAPFIGPIKPKQDLATSTHMNNQHVQNSIDAMCGTSAQLPTDFHSIRQPRRRPDTPSWTTRP